VLAFDQNLKKNCQNSKHRKKRPRTKKAQFEKKKTKKNLICDVCENFNIEFSTKASVEKKLCSL